MSLHSRITANDSTKIPVHIFSAYLHIWLNDSEGLGAVAGARAVTSLELTASEISEASAIKTKHEEIVDSVDQLEFARRVHHACLLAETEEISKSEFELLLGI